MTALRFSLARETWEEQHQAGRYNPGLVARVHVSAHVLEAYRRARVAAMARAESADRFIAGEQNR